MVRLRVAAGVFALVLVMVNVVGEWSPRTAAAAGDCWSIELSLDPEEVAFQQLLNQHRAQHGLPPLSISTNLTRTASWQAYDMGTQNYFGHVNLAGQGPQERANGCGYPYPAGENLAAGPSWTSAQAAFDAFRASPSHNANMLASIYAQVGIARYYAPGSRYGWYWTTSFGTQNDGSTGLELRETESGVRSAGLSPRAWNVATVLPGGLHVSDLQGYTAWMQLPNGWWQQWAPGDFIPGGSQVGLLPYGMTMDRGRVPR